MNKQYERYLTIIQVSLDLFILNAIILSTQFFMAEDIPSEYEGAYSSYLLIVNAGWLLLCFLSGLYVRRIILNFTYFIKRTVQVYILWLILLLCYLFFFRAFSLSRFFIILTTTFFGIGLAGNRFLYLAIVHYLRTRKNIVKKVLILGLNNTAEKLTEYIEEEGVNSRMMGYIEDDERITRLTHYPVLAELRETLATAKLLQVEEIYSTIMPEENSLIYQLMYEAEKACIRFKVVPNFSLFIKRNVHIDYFRDLPVLSLRNLALDDVGNRFKKRVLDITISVLVILFILSWLMPLLGLLIFLESGAPILFKQMRTGRNLEPFPCWKLRSMKVNKDAHLQQAVKNDQRITRMGRFIRKTSLDEFPQFINVLKGEMSLVGPRPHMLKHTNDYSQVVDEYNLRQFVKPGITGWAQINGYRGEITNTQQIEMRVKLDLWYLENWTLWLDIQILFLTIYKVLKGDEHAY